MHFKSSGQISQALAFFKSLNGYGSLEFSTEFSSCSLHWFDLFLSEYTNVTNGPIIGEYYNYTYAGVLLSRNSIPNKTYMKGVAICRTSNDVHSTLQNRGMNVSDFSVSRFSRTINFNIYCFSISRYSDRPIFKNFDDRIRATLFP